MYASLCKNECISFSATKDRYQDPFYRSKHLSLYNYRDIVIIFLSPPYPAPVSGNEFLIIIAVHFYDPTALIILY